MTLAELRQPHKMLFYKHALVEAFDSEVGVELVKVIFGFRYSGRAQKRLTTPSSATAEGGAACAERRRGQVCGWEHRL